MKSFDNNLYLWNEDHTFKQYKQEWWDPKKLAIELKSTIVAASGSLQVHEGLHIEEGYLLKIIRNNYLIKIKGYDENTQKEIEQSNFGEIEILGPVVIYEINFGWPLEYTYLYKDYNIDNLQQSNVWAERLVNSGNLRGNARDQEDIWTLDDNQYEITPDEMKEKNTYTVKSASFCCSSNKQNYWIHFKSWPSKSQIQTEKLRYFIKGHEPNESLNNEPLNILNWGTKVRPGLLFLDTCASRDSVKQVNNTTITCDDKLLQHPVGGEIIVIERPPANDLFIRSQEMQQVFKKGANKAAIFIPEAYCYRYFPTIGTWEIDPDDKKLKCHEILYTLSNFYIPGTFKWKFQLTDTVEDAFISWSVDAEEKHREVGDYTYRLYLIDDDHNYSRPHDDNITVNLVPDWQAGNEYVRQWFPTDSHIIYPTKENASFSAELNLPEVQIYRINKNTNTTWKNTSNDIVRSLCFENKTYSTPFITSGSLNLNVRTLGEWTLAKYTGLNTNMPTDIIDNSLYAQIRVHNFWRFPSDPDEIIEFEVEDFAQNKMLFGEWQDKKDNQYLTYNGKRIKTFWKPKLLPSDHYLFNIEKFIDKEVARKEITQEIDGKTYQLRIFKSIGCWDLLAGRLAPLSSVHTFKNETVEWESNDTTPHVSVDDTAEAQYEMLLANKTITAEALKDNETQFENLFHYLPYMTNKTKTFGASPGYRNTTVWEGYAQLTFNSQLCNYNSGEYYFRTAYFVEPDVLRVDANQQIEMNSGLTCGVYWVSNSLMISYDCNEGLQIINYTADEQTARCTPTPSLPEGTKGTITLPPLSCTNIVKFTTTPDDDVIRVEVPELITLEIDPATKKSTWVIYLDTREWYYNGNYMGVCEIKE